MLESLNRPITEVQTLASTPGVPALGSRVQIGINEYIFLKGITNGAAGAWVTFDEVGVTALLAADAFGPVAVMMAAGDANTKGVWCCIYGTCSAKVATGFADNGNIYATATAGTADDAAVAGDLVHNAVGRSAISSGLATVQLWYPFIDNNVDDATA